MEACELSPALGVEVRGLDPRRPLTEEDARELRRLQPELFLVAEIDARLVGTCVAGFDGHRGWVHLVAVTPQYRRRGIGSALLLEAESLLAAMGCPKLNLQVRAASPEAVQFYEKLGFQTEERISMGKLLPPGHVPGSQE